MLFMCIAPNGWAVADTVAKARKAAESHASSMREYIVWELPGKRDQYRVCPIDGTLEWQKGAPDPIRVRRRWKDGRIDRARRTVAELLIEQKAG